MDNRAGERKDEIVRCIGNGDRLARDFFADLLVALPDDEHRSLAEAPDGSHTLFEKSPGIIDRGRTERKHEWWLAVLQELAQLGFERLVRRPIEWEPSYARLRWPVRLRFTKHSRKEPKRANGRVLTLPQRVVRHRSQPELGMQVVPLHCPGIGEPTRQFQHGPGGSWSKPPENVCHCAWSNERWLIGREIPHRLHDCRNPRQTAGLRGKS